MNEKDLGTKALIALQYVEELSYKKKANLLAAVGDPSLLPSSKAEAVKILGAQAAEEFLKCFDKIDDIIAELEKREISWVSLYSDSYPELLSQIFDPPHVLFVKGDASLLSSKCIGVVGTRTPTRYGIKVADEFTRSFCRAGLTVVSGFARGVDSVAHKACVSSSSPTIAVFACGLDICYPAENRGLMDGIISSGGAIISEYALGTKPLQYHFPERNRIISGLSKAVFLAEAAKKSGSLITVRLAIEQGRDVFAVPGNIYTAESEGCNQLLMEMPHALVISADGVLDAMHISRETVQRETVELSIAENSIVEALHDGEMHFEELLDATGLSVSELTNTLFNLELNGTVENTGGNYYALT